MELYCVASVLTGPTDSFATVVPRALAGNDLAREERDPRGRNFQFEVFTAALIRLAGIRGVDSAEPDIRIAAGNDAIGIAVKRITSLDQRQREKNLDKAIKQLRREGIGGIIAINLDAVIGDAFLRHGHEAAVELLSDITKKARDYVEKVNARPFPLGTNANAIAQGVLGFATLLGWDPSVVPAALCLDVSCHAALTVPDGMEQHVSGFLTQRGRYLSNALQALLDRLGQ